MAGRDEFDLTDFLPYLLNMAAEQASLGFQAVYKERYGMLRTEWRVLFHLGRTGDMTAREISIRARIHKTKISRAVAALEARRFLSREAMENDRRQERLALTAQGRAAFIDLCRVAQDYDGRLTAGLDAEEVRLLRASLRRLAGL